jgi:hypothetical protein
MVIVGSAVGVDAWFLGFFAVILAVSLMVVGLAMGLAHLVSLHRSGARA